MFEDGVAHVGTDETGMAGGGGESIDWREAHRQLQRIARRRASLDADEASWLVIARDAGVHRELGFRSMVDYVAHTLGCQPRTAYERLRVAEALVDLPVLRAALATGATSWCAVRELTRVATPETEQAWLDRAAGKTIRDLEQLVARQALRGLGFVGHEARAAVERARAHVGETDGLEAVIRASLRQAYSARAAP